MADLLKLLFGLIVDTVFGLLVLFAFCLHVIYPLFMFIREGFKKIAKVVNK